MNTKADNRLTPKRIGEWAMNNTNILLMFLLIIVGALTSESFFSGHNLANVLRQITVNGMLAVACTMTLLVNGFDLSIGHCMALSAVLCIGFEKQYGGGVAILVACLQNRKVKFDDKLEIMGQGISDKNIITMLLIFLTAGAFVGVVGRSSAQSVAYFLLDIVLNIFLFFLCASDTASE